MAIPKTPGAIADRLYKLKGLIADANKAVDALKTERTELEAELFRLLPKDMTGVVGKTCKAVVVEKDEPQVEDWDAFRRYIVRTKKWELLQKRVGTTAVRELWDDGKQIPGVTAFKVKSFSLTKAS